MLLALRDHDPPILLSGDSVHLLLGDVGEPLEGHELEILEPGDVIQDNGVEAPCLDSSWGESSSDLVHLGWSRERNGLDLLSHLGCVDTAQLSWLLPT